MAKRRVQYVFYRLVAIRHRGDDGRVLAAGLGKQVHIGSRVEHFQRGVSAAGQDYRVDRRVCGETCANPGAGARHELQNLARYSSAPERAAQFVGRVDGVRGGLEDHAVARGQSCGNATAGNRDREVPRRNYRDNPLWLCFDAGQGLKIQRRAAIVIDKIHGFGHFGIRLQQGLAAFGHRRAHQVRPRDTELVCRFREYRRAPLRTVAGPGSRAGLRTRLDPWPRPDRRPRPVGSRCADRDGRHGSDRAAGPLAGSRQRRTAQRKAWRRRPAPGHRS